MPFLLIVPFFWEIFAVKPKKINKLYFKEKEKEKDREREREKIDEKTVSRRTERLRAEQQGSREGRGKARVQTLDPIAADEFLGFRVLGQRGLLLAGDDGVERSVWVVSAPYAAADAGVGGF